MKSGLLLSVLCFIQFIVIFSIYSNEIDDVYEVEEVCDEKGCRFKNSITLPSPSVNNNNNDLQQQSQPPPCVDRGNQCADFKRQGQCESEPGEMSFQCPVTCNFCHLMDPKVRCDKARMNVSTTPSVPTGGLKTLFTNIVNKFSDTYEIKVLSSDPWVIVIDDFLSNEEIDGFMKATDNSMDTWSKSVEFTGSDSFGNAHRTETHARTSTSLWCDSKYCQNHRSTRSISKKISELLGMPNIERQSEAFQLLKYEPGQFYKPHHDITPSQKDLACGPRILTFFLYLSDVEEGGETLFVDLGKEVYPKRGRAVLWPSVQDSNLDLMDMRTTHEARPVIRGRKFAVNSWIHQYNFDVTYKWGCCYI